MNKPVAWMDDLSFFTEKPDDMDGVTPLYTHPAELTDEEILHIQAICHLKDVGYDNFIMRFARAILRKAQEKMTDTITLAELRKTELYRKEQTRSLREFLEPKTIWVYTKNEVRVTSNERCQMWVDEFGFTESLEQY